MSFQSLKTSRSPEDQLKSCYFLQWHTKVEAFLRAPPAKGLMVFIRRLVWIHGTTSERLCRSCRHGLKANKRDGEKARVCERSRRRSVSVRAAYTDFQRVSLPGTLQTDGFGSAELCVGISCLLAKSEPQNHFSLRLFVTPPQNPKTDAATGRRRPILFRAISFPSFLRLNNTYSPLLLLLRREKLFIFSFFLFSLCLSFNRCTVSAE